MDDTVYVGMHAAAQVIASVERRPDGLHCYAKDGAILQVVVDSEPPPIVTAETPGENQ